MRLEPKALVLLIIAAMAVIGWASPAPGLKSETDPLSCHIPGNTAGCASVYCPTVSNPNFVIEYACAVSASMCRLYLQRTTTFSTSSTSFVTVTGMSGAAWQTDGGASCSLGFAYCHVTFNFNTNSLTGNAQFKIRDTTFSSDSQIYQADAAAEAVVSSDVMGSIIWFNTGFGIIGDTVAFQVKVSVGTMTLSIVKADMFCMGTTGLSEIVS